MTKRSETAATPASPLDGFITEKNGTSFLHRLPILGLCGFSGSGKTTLIEAVLPQLIGRGLAVAVVKHDAHRVEVDRPGKDSDRFFRAGADVFLRGDEHFSRSHVAGAPSLPFLLTDLSRRYDLVLVEGYKHSDLPRIWLTGPEGKPPPASAANILDIYPFAADLPGRLLAFIDDFLRCRQEQALTCGCILIGGSSTRMGRPKQLLTRDGRTWLEHSAGLLAGHVDQLVLCGKGEIPPSLGHLLRLPDAPDTRGPLAGVLAAMRWAPAADWLVAACDMPCMHSGAISWLLDQRRPGVWAVVPHTDRPQPLFAWYSRRVRRLFEEESLSPAPRIGGIAGRPRIDSPKVPSHLAECWANCNRPEDLRPAFTG